MFHRILVEEWQRVLSLFSVLIFFGCFLLIALRALRLPKKQAEHLASLPLADDTLPHERTR